MPFSFKAVRSIRGRKEESDAHAKVRKATSTDPKCPSESQLKSIAEMTYHRPQFQQVMEALAVKLVGRDGDWRNVYKALILLEHCLRAGSKDVADHFREQFYIIDVLEKFQCVDEKHIDQGLHVRRLAKQTNDLLRNRTRLRSERRKHALHLDPGDDQPDEEELVEQAIAESLRIAAPPSSPPVTSHKISSLTIGPADVDRGIDEKEEFKPSHYQTKVLEATNNDPEGPSEEQMRKIARLTDTYQTTEYFLKVMYVIHLRLSERGKYWRHVFKALLVLDYCLRIGSKEVADYFREQDHIKCIDSLRMFRHVDETRKDKGALVRQLATNVYRLLIDKDRLQRERKGRTLFPDGDSDEEDEREFDDGLGDIPEDDLLRLAVLESQQSTGPARSSNAEAEEDLDLERAIEESRRMFESELAAKQGACSTTDAGDHRASSLQEPDEPESVPSPPLPPSLLPPPPPRHYSEKWAYDELPGYTA